jgi:hypothetical protein
VFEKLDRFEEGRRQRAEGFYETPAIKSGD